MASKRCHARPAGCCCYIKTFCMWTLLEARMSSKSKITRCGFQLWKINMLKLV